ncbi:MAG: hypothetical protein GYB67_14355 [Chloroflexi bacterium]|nr:hypothetical protein [Chloroflexota bacterium]
MNRRLILIIVGITAALAVVILLTAALVPEQLHPAFAAAVAFANAAGQGDDATAFALLGPELQAYVRANCPDGSVSACVNAYTPPEWGDLLAAVYRRAAPDGPDAWDVNLVATYAEGVGFSGVCIYTRTEQIAPEDWRIVEWAGYIHCGDGRSRNMATNPETPHRAP